MCLLLTSALLAQQAPDDGVARFGTTVVASSGFRGEIYYIRHWTSRLPNRIITNREGRKKAAGTIYTSALNVPPQAFTTGFPGVSKRTEWFAIDYSARFWVRTPGIYYFSLLSDDGADLFIDNHLVIDNDGEHPPVEKTGSIKLSTGIHRIRVPYYQGPRWMVALVLKVSEPGNRPFHIFDTEAFKPPGDLKDWDSQTPDK